MKKNALISSILTIALCVSLIAGSTFALFTSEDAINVAVNAAKVNVVAEVGNFETYSMDVLQPAGKFENGGTAEYDEKTGIFTLTNIAPGDRVEFPINITNNSNINIQYRVKWAVDGELMNALVATVDGVALTTATSSWAPWTTQEDKNKTLELSVELPIDTADDYQEKTAEVAFVVEAVQGNAIVEEVTTAEQLYAALSVDTTATLMNDIVLEEGVSLNVPEGVVSVIDLGNYSITGNISKSEGHVIDNDGTLTIIGGTINSTAPNGGSAIRNDGVITVNGTTINGATAAGGSWPSYAINHYGSMMTVTDATITSNHGAISAYGDMEINNATVTLNGIGFSSHLFYIGGEGTEVVINGGTYNHKNTDGSLAYIMTGTKLTVNGGTFTAVGGGYGHATYTGELVVNGGTFNNEFVDWGGPITIYGGTFKTKPATNQIAEYYEAVDNDNGTYTVQVKDGVNFVKDDAELAAIIDAINTDSAYWNTPITVVMAAGEYSGEYTIKQYPGYTAGGAYVDVNSTTDYIDLTMDAKDGVLFTGHLTVIGNGNGGGYATNHIGTTFNNFTFNATNSYVSETTRRNVLLKYGTDNVTFDGCAFKNATHINVGESGTSSVFNTAFVNCTFDNGGVISGYWPGSSQSALTLDNCNGDMGNKGIVNSQKAGYISIVNSTLEAGGYGFRTNSGMNISVEDSSITIRDKAPLVFFRGTASSATFTNCDLSYATPVAYLNGANSNNTSMTIDGAEVVVTSASEQTGFSSAVASGDNVTVNLGEGNYFMPNASSKTISILGTKDTVINVTTPNLGGSNVSFEGVTVKTGNANYQGVQHVDTVTYTDVTFDGGMNLYGSKIVFNNCVFNLTSQYIWTYDGQIVEFNNCVFNTQGKAILVYNEGSSSSSVTVKDCTFNATKAAYTWDNQYVAAVEVDASEADEEGRTFTVNFEGTNTVNFTGTAADDKGNSGFNGLYRVKNASVSLTDHYTINVDGEQVLPNP